MSPSCELCEAAALTRRFEEGPDYWIAECEACGVPLVVWRTHDALPPPAIRVALWLRLARVANEELGVGAWRLDDRLRTIGGHYHAHARRRPRGGGWPPSV